MIETRLTTRGVLGPGGAIAQMLDGYESRPAQLAASDLIESAIADESHAVIEAGTGTGKSLAYLVPAVLCGQTTIVSTADKGLQEQLWTKDIPFLQSVMPRPFGAAILKGRGNYVCLANVVKLREQVDGTMFEEATFKNAESATAWPDVDNWIEMQRNDGGSGDLESYPTSIPLELRQQITATSDDCTGRKCPLYSVCFSEAAKERAKQAQVVVVNHHLLLRDLELRAQTGGMASMLPNAKVIVLDEAHQMEDIATGAFTIEIGAGRVLRLMAKLEALTVRHRDAKTEGTESKDLAEQWQERMRVSAAAIGEILSTLDHRLVEANVSAQRLGDERSLMRRPAAIWKRLAELMREGRPDWLTDEDDQERWDILTEQVAGLGVELQEMAYSDTEDGVVRYVEAEGEGDRRRITMCRAPIDVSDLLRKKLWSLTYWRRKDEQPGNNASPVSVIAVSATIATNGTMRYWRSRCGTPAPARELVVGSPFDYASNGRLYIPADSEAFDPSQSRGEQADRYRRLVVAEMERLVRMSAGRAFLLFTSGRMLREVYAELAPRLSDLQVLRQGESSRSELVRLFKERPSVLFGLKSFWEGVDVPGEALSLVIIDKMPFTPPGDPIHDARCEMIQQRALANGVPYNRAKWMHFDELVIPQAVIALKQGAGRLIRTTRDRGVCAILDGRLLTKKYGEQVIRSLPPFGRAGSLDEVAAFFARTA